MEEVNGRKEEVKGNTGGRVRRKEERGKRSGSDWRKKE
jgi:hypothetical protein